MMKRKRKKKNVVTSGDKVVDWIFDRVCEVLDDGTVKVTLVRFKETNLLGEIDKNCKKHDFEGFNCVHISRYLSERGKWRIFFHEILHILFENTKERPMRRGEGLIWGKMSEEQKQIIASHFRKLLRSSRESSTKSGQKI